MDKSWNENHPIIKTGHFYNVTRDYKIYFRIRTSDMMPGYGDDHDGDAVDDNYIDCFKLEQSIDKDFKTGGGGGYFETIEAITGFIKRHTKDEIVFDD